MRGEYRSDIGVCGASGIRPRLQGDRRGVPGSAGWDTDAGTAINKACPSLIFNCADGLHLCCSVMQTLSYILSGLIVIRAENLIKPNNNGNCRSFFFSPQSTSVLLTLWCPCADARARLTNPSMHCV